MDVKTILWPTDLSKASIQAAPNVVTLAKQFGAEVIALYVGVDLCSYFPAYGNYPSDSELKDFQNWELEQAKKKLETVCSREMSACPNLSIELVQGDPAEQILALAKSKNADMIVMSARGGSEATPGFGSVTQKVLYGAEIPVHVVK